MYNTWCLTVSTDILNIPDIPNIPEFPLFLKFPTFQTFPFYYHAKYGCPSSKIGRVIAICVKCAKIIPEKKKKKDISLL